MKQELTCIWPNLARVCEIAFVGDLTVDIVYDTVTYPEMPEDFEMIKGYYKEIKFENPGDLTVVLCCPETSHGAGEKWGDVKLRAESVEIKELKLEQKSGQLFEQILKRFQSSISKRNLILRIANIIACMDKSTITQACHIAESFQYAGFQIEVSEQSVFSSIAKNNIKNFIDLLTDEQLEKVNKYAHKIYNN